MFRFSRYLDKKEDLEPWQAWFTKKKIAWALERRSGKYALWREGEEAVDETRTRPAPIEHLAKSRISEQWKPKDDPPRYRQCRHCGAVHKDPSVKAAKPPKRQKEEKGMLTHGYD